MRRIVGALIVGFMVLAAVAPVEARGKRSLWTAVGAGAGFGVGLLVAPVLSRAHFTVNLAEQVALEKAGLVEKGSTEETRAFYETNTTFDELMAKGQAMKDKIRMGSGILGAFIGLSVAAHDPRVRAVVDFFGGLPDEIAASSTRLAPTLILHGDADAIVPVSEAHKLRAALEARAVPHEIRIYPGEGHIFSPLAAIDAAGRTMTFLSRHLKDNSHG